MPGENIQDWSTTAASNSNADSSINWAEGQTRASVNNSARSMMAAHAKQRNLQNGSITTTGTANAQAFASGMSYTVVPSGLRVLLKIGAALNNTGAMTLEMDGITAVEVKDEAGNSLRGGEVVGGGYSEFLFDGSFWVHLTAGATTVAPQCGRLEYALPTGCLFAPFNGDKIKINGLIFDIPSGGIPGLANTGVFVDGVGGSNLAANSVYRVCAFNNAGAITADFTTSAHGRSATPGNIGTEIKVGDDTRTLIGMVYTDGSGQFQDSAIVRGVISWFNRRPMALQNTTSLPVFSTSMVNLGGTVTFLSWQDNAVTATAEGYATAAGAPGVAYVQVQLAHNGGLVGMASNDSNAFGLYANWAISHAAIVTEGVNSFHMFGGSPTGDTQQMTFIVNAMTYG